MINTAKIKERMRVLGITQRDMAKVFKMSPAAVNLKINLKSATTLDEAKIFAGILDIKSSELKEYFFK